MRETEFARLRFHPSRYFGAPEEVADDPGLTGDEKLAVLRSWEYDARALEVAEDEGMEAGDPSLLRRILLAQQRLGVEVHLERSAPTRQHGG